MTRMVLLLRRRFTAFHLAQNRADSTPVRAWEHQWDGGCWREAD
jgi:hypothetical protein